MLSEGLLENGFLLLYLLQDIVHEPFGQLNVRTAGLKLEDTAELEPVCCDHDQFADTLLGNAQFIGKLLIRDAVPDKAVIGMNHIAGIDNRCALCLSCRRFCGIRLLKSGCPHNHGDIGNTFPLRIDLHQERVIKI